jgi:hypothetical protein
MLGSASSGSMMTAREQEGGFKFATEESLLLRISEKQIAGRRREKVMCEEQNLSYPLLDYNENNDLTRTILTLCYEPVSYTLCPYPMLTIFILPIAMRDRLLCAQIYSIILLIRIHNNRWRSWDTVV